MRRMIMAAVLAGSAHVAQAADMPDFSNFALRGPVNTGVVNWQGFYVGGQGGIGSSDMNFTGATKNIVARLLSGTTMENEFQVSQWPVLGRESKQSTGWGGFIGYNNQWEDVVLGLEASYLHGGFGGNSSGSMSRFFTTSSGYTDSVTNSANASFNITDMGSIRARAGYAMSNFLPYVFGGLSLGQANVTKTASVSGLQVNNSLPPSDPFYSVPFSYSQSESQNHRWIYGYAAGVGIDVKLAGGLFLRGEWEYLKFVGPIDTSVNTVRGGIGYQF